MSNHHLQTFDSAENPKVIIPLIENNMEVLEYIRLEMAGMRRYVNMTMKDITSELFNGATPGTNCAAQSSGVFRCPELVLFGRGSSRDSCADTVRLKICPQIMGSARLQGQ